VRALVRSDLGAGPALVYVPGLDGSGALLLGSEEPLARRFRLLTLRYATSAEDRAAPPAGAAYSTLAASVLSAVGERVDGPVLLLAESFGVAVALEAALDRPERVAGLALVNGFAHHPWRARLALSRATLPLVPRSLFRLVRRRFGPRTLFGEDLEPGVRRAFLSVVGTFPDDGYRRRLEMLSRVDLRPRLPELRRPVALFASDEDRIVPSVRAAREMQALLPDAELEVIEGGGHLVLPIPAQPWRERLERLAVRAGLITSASTCCGP